MGMWAKIAGIGLAAAGVMSTNPYLVAAGVGMVQNDIKNEGVKKAEKQQLAASNRALAVQQDQFNKVADTQAQLHNQVQQNYSPYMQGGSQAFSTLNTLMGLPATPVTGAFTPMAPMTATTNTAGMQTPISDMVESSETRAGVSPNASRQRGGTPQEQARLTTESGYGATPRLGMVRGGGLVRMKAPDGSTKMVPAEQVGFFEQRGASVLSEMA